MVSRNESPAGYILAASLGALLIGLIVHEEACQSAPPPPAPEDQRGYAPAKTVGKRIASRVIRTTQVEASERMREAAGGFGVQRYLAYMRDEADAPAAPCASARGSDLPGVALRMPVESLFIESKRFAAEDAKIRIPYDVEIEGSPTFSGVEFDDSSGCKPPRQAMVTIFADAIGSRYRYSICGPTPGSYEPATGRWTFDAAWEEFEFGWDGFASNYAAPDRPNVWRGERSLFPPGTARFRVDLRGTRNGDPFHVWAEMPVVVGPFETDDYRCSTVAPTEMPTTAFNSNDDASSRADER